MEKDILMPNYEHSILNLITSILKNYKVETKYNGLEKIDKLLEKKYKNVVLIILDGMGENVLKHNNISVSINYSSCNDNILFRKTSY